MFHFYDILPYSETAFYIVAACAVAFTWILKGIANSFGDSKLYSSWLLFLTVAYTIFMYTNPLGIFLFVFYGYLVYRFISRRNDRWRVVAVILYILPLFLNKFLGVVPEMKTDLRKVLQIAGISYMTFKMVQVHLDESDRDVIGPGRFFLFLSFTPTVLIGPIDRYKRFSDNLQLGFSAINQDNLVSGFNFFIRGLLYKYVLAHAIQTLVLNHLEGFGFWMHHVCYMYSYLMYLFFDFAGYSLLAMGLGYMLGVQVPFNFNSPFLAVNPKEFWQRWHKTLGDWLNDFFFRPILKSLSLKNFSTPLVRQNIALFATFSLMGCWNGFELHFILSGMLFGLYSVVHNYYSVQCKKLKRDVVFGSLPPHLVRAISIFIMFNLVAFAIYIFSGNII
jgi:membrane protein involved in D-alanine export